MPQLNLQLYARTASKGFSEQLSVRRTVTLTPDTDRIELSLEAPARQKFVELRLDPDDKPSTFILHGLLVRSSGGEEIYRWDGSAQNRPNMVGLQVTNSDGQTILESTSQDPFLLIPLASPEASGISLELSVSLPIDADQGKVADAVRSLQSTLRHAIDDLASEQEGMLDALVVQQAQARSATQAIDEHLQTVLGRAEQTATSLRKMQNDLMTEIRDDWRSVRQLVSDNAEAALKKGRQRDAEITDHIQDEFAKLIQAVHRVAGSEDLLREVRKELGVARDDEVVGKIQQLKSDAQAARDRTRRMEQSLSWRLTGPFRLFSGD